MNQNISHKTFSPLRPDQRSHPVLTKSLLPRGCSSRRRSALRSVNQRSSSPSHWVDCQRSRPQLPSSPMPAAVRRHLSTRVSIVVMVSDLCPCSLSWINTSGWGHGSEVRTTVDSFVPSRFLLSWFFVSFSNSDSGLKKCSNEYKRWWFWEMISDTLACSSGTSSQPRSDVIVFVFLFQG